MIQYKTNEPHEQTETRLVVQFYKNRLKNCLFPGQDDLELVRIFGNSQDHSDIMRNLPTKKLTVNQFTGV